MSQEPYRFQKSLFSEANEELVRRLREARKDAGLSQIEVAKRLGCRQTFISKMECGGRRIDVAELLLLLRVYEVEPGDFLKNLLPKVGRRKSSFES